MSSAACTVGIGWVLMLTCACASLTGRQRATVSRGRRALTRPTKSGSARERCGRSARRLHIHRLTPLVDAEMSFDELMTCVCELQQRLARASASGQVGCTAAETLLTSSSLSYTRLAPMIYMPSSSLCRDHVSRRRH